MGSDSFNREHRASGLSQLCFLLSCRYEDEINKRTNAENEFVTIKKVSQFCGVELTCETIDKGHGREEPCR